MHQYQGVQGDAGHTEIPIHTNAPQAQTKYDPYQIIEHDLRGEGGGSQDGGFSPNRGFQRRSTRLLSREDHWHWEVISALFSVLFLMAIIIILAKVDNELLSSWNIKLSINTVVSILSTASKACMILPIAESLSQLKWLELSNNARDHEVHNLQAFDTASRGPLGAIFFFFYARKAPLIAHFGCFLVVVTLAFDPFAQQILVYNPGVMQNTALVSKVSYSQDYDFDNVGVVNPLGATSSNRDLPMRQAAMSGLYEEPYAAPFFCPGSNCTYPPFQSFGICSHTTDVSAATLSTKSCTNLTKYPQTCNYTTPAGHSLIMSAVYGTHGLFYSQINSSLLSRQLGGFSDLAYLPNISSWALGTCSTTNLDPGSTNWSDTLKAYDISLRYCALHYANFSAVNGVLVEGTTTPYELNATLSNEKGATMDLQVTDPTFPGNLSANYTLNFYDFTNLQSILDEMFDYTGSDGTVSASSYLPIAALQGSTDLVLTMSNMSKSLSNRMLSGPNATFVSGNVYETHTIVHVTWPWLTLPIALIVASCAFLAYVMLRTHREQQRPWKSSLRPLLKLASDQTMASRLGDWATVREVSRGGGAGVKVP